MAGKHQLRKQRAGTVINLTSKKQEGILGDALRDVERLIKTKFPQIRLYHKQKVPLEDMVKKLKANFPDLEFHYESSKSFMKPDGGVLSILNAQNQVFPVLITEVKNQGTNDLRKAEGKKKQAKGNAIERLGKNVIGFRCSMLNEHIFPFVCFGYGCDFEEGSTIRDRVVTIAMFGKLNVTRVSNEGKGGAFNRGSFYFQEKPWSKERMVAIMSDIAIRSIQYYFSKYGENTFLLQKP